MMIFLFPMPSKRKGESASDVQTSPQQYVVNTRTDKAVFIVALTTFFTFLLLFLLPIRSLGIRTIWLLYPNVLLAIGCFGFLIRTRSDIGEDLLLHSVLFGSAATATYLPMDWGFSKKVRFIIYRSTDFFGNVTTPIGLILTWVILATLAIYFYHRLQMFGLHQWVASGITGVAVALGSVIIYGLGKELWEWNVLRVGSIPHIASVPIFIPITFMLTFILCPYYFYRKQPALLAGIRCGLFMGIVMIISYIILWRI